MVHLKSKREIEKLRASAELVSRTLAEVGRHVAVGVTTNELDAIAEDFIRTHGAEPAFKGHRHGKNVFPATLCTSVNDHVVHGIPSDYALQPGDLLSVDCGVVLDGFIGDSAFTFAVGTLADEDYTLCRVTHEGLNAGIEAAVAGHHIGDIGAAVEARCADYGIVRDLCGHGVGRSLWEQPQVPNYGSPGTGRTLRKGLTICIEPMINHGTAEVYTADDGWTVATADGTRSAHYEHMIAVRDGAPEVLSTFDYIEDVTVPPYLRPESTSTDDT
ncbi:type I methionyl aminopeptidase [Salisaeta longa]|uniref:type I methionyl aminopeptidase n=1 Tax=Salisaeta longa TaxID=503170 RepID=UPI0003B6D19B|nr:type I methionyl aminopeptidase [Salisaeta longa]